MWIETNLQQLRESKSLEKQRQKIDQEIIKRILQLRQYFDQQNIGEKTRMKSPSNKIVREVSGDKIEGLNNLANDYSFKDNAIFGEQSTSYRQKSIDRKIIQLNDNEIKTLVRRGNYRGAVEKLHELQAQIHSQNHESCRTDKLLFYYQLSVCYYNHSAVYQKVNNDQQTARYFEKALKNLQYMQGYITNRQEGVSYSIELTKLQIQYCSILSQNGKHEEAITFAEKALQKIIQSFRILQAICFEIIMSCRLPETNSNSRDSRTKIELVNFKTHVLFQAQKLLKELSALPESHQLTTKFKKKYDSLMQKMFFWKDNSENNEKQLRKQLQVERKQVNSDRNILGVQKNSLFNDNLTLQSLTNLQIKSIQYSFKTDPFFLLSVPKLTEMAFYVSMIYFMLATQIRFSQVDLNVNKLKIDEKYKKLSRDERMIKCKMIHMKAIEIAGKFLPQKNQFFSHILNRFNKNYKCVMQQINEQSREQSMKQIQSQKIIQQQQQILPEHEYGIPKNQSLINQLILKEDQISPINSPQLGSMKKIKKGKLMNIDFGQNQNHVSKRKMSSSKQKQSVQIFQKHKRSTSQSQNHKRSSSQNMRQRSNGSTKMISSHKIPQQHQTRDKLRTINNSVRKSEEKVMKKNKYVDNFFDKDRVVENEGMMDKGEKDQRMQDHKQRRKRAMLSPNNKSKLSMCKVKLKTQESLDIRDNKNKKTLVHKKHNN